jgi:hypothetical protein
VGVGSKGTTADTATVAVAAGAFVAVTWTPTGNRTDARLYVQHVSGAAGNRLDFSAVMVAPFRVTTPVYTRGLGLDEPASFTRVTDDAQATTCAEIVTLAVAGSGVEIAHGFDAIATGHSGQPLMLTVDAWVPSGTGSIQIGMGSPTSGTDYATATFTATTTRTTFVVAWTPSAYRDDCIAWIAAGAASAITLRFTDVQVTTGKGVQRFRPIQCDGIDALETDICPSTGFGTGDPWAAIGEVSSQLGGRHWITALTQRPWWQLTTSHRSRVDTQAVAETLNDDVQDAAGFEQDASQIANHVRVQFTDPGYVPDAGKTASNGEAVVAVDSNTARMRRLGIKVAEIGGALVNAPVPYTDPDETAQDLADRYLAAHCTGRYAPRVTVHNRFPSQVARQIGDVVALNYQRARIYGARYSIQFQDIRVASGALDWTTVWTLEEIT